MEFVRAESLEHAIESLARFGDRARVLAGGTCVMPSLASGALRPEALIALDRLSELSGTREADGGLEFGALTRLDELTGSKELGDSRRILTEAAVGVGSWQTRCVATMGGNICQADSNGDLLPALLVCDATVEVCSHERRTQRAKLESVLGNGSALEADELLTRIVVPTPSAGTQSFYAKVGRRSAMEVAIVSVAFSAQVTSAGELREIRFAGSGLSPHPRRFPAAEERLTGNPGEAEIAAAIEALIEESEVEDDIWASARYRRAVAARLLRQAVKGVSSERAQA